MKPPGSVLLFLMVILVAHALPAHAATWEDATGPYPTIAVANAGPEGKYYIQRPKTLKPNAHPIVVFAGGTGSHPRDYDPMLAPLASHGVVIIADTDAYQGAGPKADAALNWLLAQNEAPGSEYFGKLIPSKVLGIGHSSGANGVMLAAINNPKIRSLLLYAPTLVISPSDVSVPTFYIAGALDTTADPEFVKRKYREATKASAWYGESKDQGHIGFGRNAPVQYFTRAWMYTQLFDDSGTARGCFYGPDWTLKNAPGWNETLRTNADH